MKHRSPNGPTVPQSTKFNDNTTRILKITDTFRSNVINVGHVILTNGQVKNLSEPIENSNAATYAYAGQGPSIGVTPGGPLHSIQYNDSGILSGSESFTFNPSTKTLKSNIQCNNVNIKDGTITGLETPLLDDHAATKGYVDSSKGSVELIEINDPSSVVYPITKIDIVIIRNTLNDTSIIDYLPDATGIISTLSLTVGSCVYLKIKNINTHINNSVSFRLGAGIISDDYRNCKIYSDYQYNGVLIMTGPGEIKLITLSCLTTNNAAYKSISDSAYETDTVYISDHLMRYTRTNKLQGESPYAVYRINAINASNGIVLIDTEYYYFDIESPEGFFRQEVSSSNGVIYTRNILWHTGGIEVFVVNVSETYEMVLRAEQWDVVPEVTVPVGHTAWLLLTIVSDDFPNIETLTSAIYCLGIFPSY